MRNPLSALSMRPWTLAAIASAGATLLLCGALPLLAPPEFLDQLVAWGDARLELGLGASFAAGLLLFRVLLRRRRRPEEELDDAPPPKVPEAARREVEPARGYLR